MAKYQPTGLEWMNKGFKKFNQELRDVTKAMAENAIEASKVTFSLKNLNKETGEWIKRTATVVKGTEDITTTFTEMTGEVKDADGVISTIDRSFKTVDSTAQQAGGRGGGIGILTAAISGLAAAAGVFLLQALKDLIKFGLKALWEALTLPIKGFIALGKAIVKISFAGFKAGAELAKNVLIGVGEAAIWATRKIVNLGAAGLQAGIVFQEGWTGVLKASNDLVDAGGNITELGRAVKEDFIDLIREVPLLPEDILRIGELGAQLDIPSEFLAEFTRVVGAVTKATILSAEDAALGMGKIISVMGIGTDEIENFGSVLVWLGNNMGIVEDEILLMSKRITGVAVTAGFTADEVLGISAAILRLGATPYAGASAVTQAVTRIGKAVAMGGEELELFAAVSGMSSDQFIEAWQAAPADTFLEFIKGLTLAGPDAIVLLDELGLANIRVSQTFLSAAAAPWELDKALTGGRKAWRDNIALAREAQLRYETVASKIQLLKNQFSIFGVYLFDFVEPVIRGVISVGERLATWASPLMEKAFERLQPLIDDVTRGLEWLGAVVTRVLSAPNIRAAFDELLHSFNILGEERKGLLGIFDDVVEMVSGIGAIDWSVVWKNVSEWFGKAITWVIDHWPEIKETIDRVLTDIENIDWDATYKAIKDPFERAITWVVDNWPEIRKTVTDIYNDIMDFLFGPQLRDVPEFAPAITFGADEEKRVGGFIDGLVAGFDNFKQSVLSATNTIRTELLPAIGDIIENVALMFGAEADIAKDPYLAGKFTITKLGEILEGYTEIYNTILKIVEYMTRPSTQRALEFMVDPFGAAFRTSKGIAEEQLGETLTEPSIELGMAIAADLPSEEEAVGFFSRIAEIVGPGLTEALEHIYAFRLRGTNELLGMKKEWVGESIFPDLMDSIVNIFKTGLTEVGTLWSTFWTGMTTEAGFGVDTAMNALGVEQGGSSQGLLATIERSYSSFKEAGRSIVQAIADGMIEAAYMMVDALRSNIKAMNLAVDSDEVINKILFDIGEKIVTKIAAAIIKSYDIILRALELGWLCPIRYGSGVN